MELAGFGNYHQTEAVAGALPTDQNSPQRCNLGLYAEQLSGSAFTRPRHANLHSWLYRLVPSVVCGAYKPYSSSFDLDYVTEQAPNPYRWLPLNGPTKPVDFVDGLWHIAGNDHAQVYLYLCNLSMHKRYFGSHDGELLFVPYQGELSLYTELGCIALIPGKIAVIPRGIKFKVELNSPVACGYLCENNGLPFTLPQLGIIGANGLANPRHFLYPSAWYEQQAQEVTIIGKFQHRLWSAKSSHSPLNVVAWHGNYAPYCYDLHLFNTINTVSFDHPDPSIFTVLTAESSIAGVANLDFVIFPPRWLVAEHTFRPPYYHRNVMNELMGLIYGEYDAKKKDFLPGGVSIHNCMTAHGPDSATYQYAINQELEPIPYQDTLAFMLESSLPWLISKKAMAHSARQHDYSACWQQLGRVNIPSF